METNDWGGLDTRGCRGMDVLFSDHEDGNFRCSPLFHLANISSRELFSLVFLSRPSVQPANSNKSQFILFVKAILLAGSRLAKSSLFDRTSIRWSIDTTVWMPSHPLIRQKVRPWQSIWESPFLAHAFPRTSSIAKNELFQSILISQCDQKAGGDAMPCQILTLSILLSGRSVAKSVIPVSRVVCSPHFRSVRALFKADIYRRPPPIDSLNSAMAHQST
jgi:hypothetical protein